MWIRMERDRFRVSRVTSLRITSNNIHTLTTRDSKLQNKGCHVEKFQPLTSFSSLFLNSNDDSHVNFLVFISTLTSGKLS